MTTFPERRIGRESLKQVSQRAIESRLIRPKFRSTVLVALHYLSQLFNPNSSQSVKLQRSKVRINNYGTSGSEEAPLEKRRRRK